MTRKKPTESQHRTAQLSPAKRRLFLVVILVSPFVLLLCLEFGLRIFNYGGELRLVTKRTVGGKELYSINRSVARRYFTQAGVIPEPADDTFAIKKSGNTRRIFCLGESTMAGFPYEFHATAPSFLRDRLKAMLPEYDVEVINLGLSAVGTIVIQDFMDELLSYEPDLFIVYAGHNEFYGIYGVGSSIAMPGGPWLTKLNLLLLRFRSFLLLRDAYLWIHGQFTQHEQKPSQSLMGQMVGNQTIPLHSHEYEAARTIYNDNLVRLIATSQSHNIPIIFSSFVSNWRGQKPFVSTFDPATSMERQALWQARIADGDSAITHGAVDKAVQLYTQATLMDSMNASGFFKLGNALYSVSQYDDAKRVFLRAKDLDALRFRATEEFQRDLTRICTQFSVPMARVDSAFMNASPHGILDDALFLEHLHPNINGYFLMAKTLCRAMAYNNLLVGSTDWNRTTEPTDSVLMELSRVTEFDRAVGKVKIDMLKRRWPFETGKVNYEFVASNSVESVVFRMMKGGIAWSDARFLLAEFYARNKQFDLARKECLAVAKVVPYHYEPLLRYADYYSQEGRTEEAAAAYQQCFEIDDNPFARMKYAVLLLEQERPAAAATHIEIALNLDAKGKYKLPIQGVATARYVLGVAYAKLGKVDLAKENLQRALAIEPTYGEANDLLDQLKQKQ